MAGSALAISLGGTSQTTAAGARIALGLELGSDVQPFDSDLSAIAALSGTGIIVRTGAGTAATRTITGTANRISVADGNGVSGNPTIDIAATYVGQSSITTLGTITAGTWNGTAIAVLNGGTGATTAANARINLGLVIGTDVFTQRTITGTTDKITVANGNGVSGNPTIDIAATYIGQSSITTLGTVTTGTWGGTTIAVLSGGTGATTAANARTNLGLVVGTDVQAFDSDLNALATNATNGIWARTGTGTGSARTITGTTNRIAVTNGNGVSGNPTIDIDSGFYSEGTFSPTMAGTTTAGVGTYTSQLGYYTRVGRLVHFYIDLQWTAHTGTGDMRIQFSGMPTPSSAASLMPVLLSIFQIGSATDIFIARFISTTQITMTRNQVEIPMDTTGTVRMTGTYFV